MEVKYDIFSDKLILTNTNHYAEADIPLKDFYIAARKESGMNISALERLCGISHPLLANIENKHDSNALKPMLIALMELGYTITIQKPTD